MVSSLSVMTRRLDDQNQNGAVPEGVEQRILEDDRRRSGEFLREFLASNRVDTPNSEGGDDVAD